ncbi:hypothetical protein BH11ARM2_BH11ARM2_39260 [soil metagenome]
MLPIKESMNRSFHTTHLFFTRLELMEVLERWVDKEAYDWSVAILGPFESVLGRGIVTTRPHRIYPLRSEGRYALTGWIEDEGEWETFAKREFILQLIRDDLGAEPSQDRRFPVDEMGYYGVPEIQLPPEPRQRRWSGCKITQTQWRNWGTHDRDPRWPVYRRAFCEIRAMLRSRAVLYSRRAGPMTLGVSHRDATAGFRDLVASRPGFGNLVIEEVPLNPGLSLYDVEGILRPEDFLE